MADQAVIVDWGGVLMRTDDRAPREAWNARLDLDSGAVEAAIFNSKAWQAVQLGRAEPDALWQAVGENLGLSPDDLVALRRDFFSGDRLDIDLIALLRDLRARGIKIGLLSNNSLDVLDEIKTLGIEDTFDAVIISAEVGIMKPDPAIYRTALDILHVEAANAVFVDDFPANVEGAQAVGMAAVHFTPDLDLRAALEKWLSEHPT